MLLYWVACPTKHSDQLNRNLADPLLQTMSLDCVQMFRMYKIVDSQFTRLNALHNRSEFDFSAGGDLLAVAVMSISVLVFRTFLP